MNIALFILSIIFTYAVDVVLVGIAFQSLKNRFSWHLSPRTSFFILFLAFAFMEYYLWPMMFILDVTYTVRNEAIAKAFNFLPNEPFVNLFDIGLFEFISCSIQALLAGYVGEKILPTKGNGTL